MSMLRIGVIAVCVLAALAGSFTLKPNTTSDVMKRQAPSVPAAAAALSGTIEIPTANDARSMTPADLSPASEFLSQSDTTGLLQESLTIDDLVDLANADPGPGFLPVDRERFAAVLRSDPELRKALGE